MRPCDAPSAMRTPISFRRRIACANARLATLPQAIMRTKVTAPMASTSMLRMRGETECVRTAEPGSGGGRIRCLCGGVVRGVLRVAAGPPESASWAVFPAAVHRLLRGSVVGAGDCVAGRGFSEPAGFPGPGRDRGAAEPLDAVAHAASDRRGNARGGFHVGAGTVGGSGSGAGEDGRRRCDDAGSERGDAEHRAAGYRGIVRGVRASAGEGIGD